MDALLIAVTVVGVVILLAWVLSYRASRIDRLHARIEGCWHALDAMFVRRSEALLELANSATLDPASSLLLSYGVSDVLELQDADPDHARRVAGENELAATATLLLAEASPAALAEVDPVMRATVQQTVRQVDVAASFYNDAVSDVIAIRDQALTKVACLAGKAPRLHRIEVASVDVAPLAGATGADVRDPLSR
ncbi:hypothetical protein ACXR2U_04350 [Jatrophihabitans sp. YIM 134969]